MVLTADEQKQLLELYQKAREPPTCEEFQLVDAPGIMSDGAKRREEPLEHNVVKRANNQGIPGTSDVPSSSLIPPHAGGVVAGYVAPPTIDPPMVPSENVGTEQLMLPPQVPDLTTWGRTVIEFGRYKNIHTYEELRTHSGSREKDYVKWCSARTDKSHGILSDFALYLAAKGAAEPGDSHQGPMIPGSSQPRRYR